MDKKDKGISLFKYLKEMYQQKITTVSDISNQLWYKFIDDIPRDEKNIHINYLDQIERDEISDLEVILKVKKPEYTVCPVLNEELLGWIDSKNYKSFRENVSPVEEIVIKADNESEDDVHILFYDNVDRVKIFENWKVLRDKWVVEQKKIQETRTFFKDLYYQYRQLQNESETIEMMIGQGCLVCKSDLSKNVKHPILLKRIVLNFDAQNNIIYVLNSEKPSELYSSFLQELDFVNYEEIKLIQGELEEYDYHPLDRKVTLNFLEATTHRLYADSKFILIDENSTIIDDEKLIVYDKPVLFIRKKISGITQSLSKIIDQIEETGVIDGPIVDLLGNNGIVELNSSDEEGIKNLAIVNGEDVDILMSKEANAEQLAIAKKIEHFNAVLVQGPPGTGKTHTIANLMGHFLSQGKNVLVTSQTKKALSVVKEKLVPELQDLCVTLLEDNNKDVNKSIDGITEFMANHNVYEVKKNIDYYLSIRKKIMDDINSTREKIYSIKYKEYENIVYEGKGYSLAEMAKFVSDNQEFLSYIPGVVKQNTLLPLSMNEVEELYKTNELLDYADEMQLKNNLPTPDEILSDLEIEQLFDDKSRLEVENEKIVNLNNWISIDDVAKLNYDIEKFGKFNDYYKNKKKQTYDNWKCTVILDSMKGIGYKEAWVKLVDAIQEAYNYCGSIRTRLIGNDIVISEDIKNKNSLEILSEMKNHLASGKKFNKMGLLFHKDWKEFISQVAINEKIIETEDDIELIEQKIKLFLKRSAIKPLWIELVEKNGGIPLSEFSDEIEQDLIYYNEVILSLLNWKDSTYNMLISAFSEIGFDKEILRSKFVLIGAFEEVRYNINVIENVIPTYLRFVEINTIILPKIKNMLNDNYTILHKRHVESNLAVNMAKALKNKDVSDYSELYGELLRLNQEIDLLNTRNMLLSRLREFAPDWTEAVRCRRGIHGGNTAPKDIKAAWKWKQFAEIIDDVNKEPFLELQNQSVTLSNKLRKTSGLLAEQKSWYHLLKNMDGDLTKKQALIGWKETTKKIGKGTGKLVPKLRKDAKKLMVICQTAVPAWIMTINQALENLDPTKNRFDIVIIDEASQLDISALAILYLAKKIIIVGDDQQVSPSAIGVDIEKIRHFGEMYIKDKIPNYQLYDMKTSIYDLAKTTYPTLMLKEHFRCVPSIIGYSNKLCYDFKIKPLRDEGNAVIKPATIAYRVKGKKDSSKKNIVEAENIVALMMACMNQNEYKDMTFGAISLLGDEQAKLINKIALEKIAPIEFEQRRIMCGNASQFQGDERDVIFISLVDNNEGEGPLRKTTEGSGNATKQRYNVAASRAKNQLWVIHSLDINNDLKEDDMRKGLIQYVSNPNSVIEQMQEIKAKSESPFELEVAELLVTKDYHVVQQWSVGSYRIDMVAICGDKKIAIECDGELYHSGEERIREDMERQTILERLGWQFIRIRGSEFYRNKDSSIARVCQELEKKGVFPESNYAIVDNNSTELKERVIAESYEILETWKKEECDSDDVFEVVEDENTYSINDNKEKKLNEKEKLIKNSCILKPETDIVNQQVELEEIST